MHRRLLAILPWALAGAGLTGACSSDDPVTISPDVKCTTTTPVNLAVGESVILDATVAKGCIRLPAADAGGAEHLMVAYSGSGQIKNNGVSGPFALGGRAVATPAPPVPVAAFSRAQAQDPATRFHDMLRRRESELALEPGRRLAAPTAPRIPPVVGDPRTFKVCASVNCNNFVNVAATARFVGPRGAIYLDNTVPPNGLTQEDIDSLGSLFDGASPNIYEIDTTAFGHESDLDGNNVVIVLLTDQVNTLSGSCPGGSIILGYFFGIDLVSDPNSNGGEVFYGLVPNPAGPNCAVSKARVFEQLPPVLAHEFQHMISFNQHVLIRGGATEVTWLNEGMSHFAEEIAGRVLPAARCPGFLDCLEQFAEGTLLNSFFYLAEPESFFLVYPASSFGELEERGASWLFVRWLSDHYATDTLLGTDLTRSLIMTSLTGSANVASATGQPFDELVGEWQMANYTEALPGFTGNNGRLRYRTWDLEAAYDAATGGAAYPLSPDLVMAGAYAGTGFLLGGSGRHVRVSQAANAGPVDFQLKGDDKFATLVPRFAIVRTQ